MGLGMSKIVAALIISFALAGCGRTTRMSNLVITPSNQSEILALIAHAIKGSDLRRAVRWNPDRLIVQTASIGQPRISGQVGDPSTAQYCVILMAKDPNGNFFRYGVVMNYLVIVTQDEADRTKTKVRLNWHTNPKVETCAIYGDVKPFNELVGHEYNDIQQEKS
jgi:hypothetical protein